MAKTKEELLEYYEQRIKNEPSLRDRLEWLSERERGCAGLNCGECPLRTHEEEFKCYQIMYAYEERWTAVDMWQLAKRILADVNVDDGFWLGGFE